MLILGIALSSCTTDQVEPLVFDCNEEDPTYTEDVKQIIDLTCAYSGCHLDLAPGNYSTYQGLLPILNTEEFTQRVIYERNMPPFYAEDGPPELTEEQMTMLQCWVESGYKE